MINTVEKISDALKLFEETLIEKVALLDQRDQVKIEQAASIENIRRVGPKGTIHLVYLGSRHNKKDMRNNAVLTDRDLQIGAIAQVQYFDEGMKPHDYVEWLNECLCGLEVENTRAEYQRKVYPINDELIDETNGEWKFMVRFGVPIEFIEQSIKQ
ncbi:MAG: hypothetical protein GYA14_14915 [Ignavibacteria bacterium]|nr:hypothetical protein [Ignavibacteria bacterium]